MNFLTINDFDTVIERELLYQIISYPNVINPNSPTQEETALITIANAKLTAAVEAAISELSGYLANRYTSSEIFNKVGSARNGLIVLKCCDIALFYLYRINSPEAMTELRENAYKNAIDFCEKVNRLELNLPDLPKPSDSSKDTILFGSNLKRNNHY
jgi:phage gp36-like protein